MSRRLARAGRLGQRSTGQGKPWSPASIPGLEGWWSADDALASVGPDVAARPGDSIRSVPDRSRHKRSMDQTTANRQPMLGYLRPPKGNILPFSIPTLATGSTSDTGWTWHSSGEVLAPEYSDIQDPHGHSAIKVNPVTSEDGNRRLALGGLDYPRRYEGDQRSAAVWVKAEDGKTVQVRIWTGGSHGSWEVVGDTWTLVRRTFPVGPNGEVSINNQEADIDVTFYVGSAYMIDPTWSDEYVETTGEAVIPDTSELPRAMVFDGVVGNMLETTEELGNAPDVTIVAVHGIQASSLVGVHARLFSGAGRANGSNSTSVRNTGVRHFVRWSQYDVATETSIEPRRAYLDIMYQQPDGRVVFRNGGQQYFSNDRSPPDPYSTSAYSMGAENLTVVNSYANGPITDILYFTRALGDDEIQRVEDYFLIKSGINRITTAPEDVKELEDVAALAPGIWYLDGEPLNEEPLQKIEVPLGSAGKELTVDDSYGIEVLP